ncbi:MAG TPA: iron-containing alcohol dehydrogenase, partial [Oceanipulchritudo sp.]|nr:iron-containing alcohol dehydrogenase [Oceanipulchritudo sp.]
MIQLATYPTGPVTAHFPPTLSFGSGKRNELPDLLGRWDIRKAVIVAAEACQKAVEELERALEEQSITVRVVYCLPTEPKIEDFVQICQKLAAVDPEVVIGIGGGSVLDIAKLVAALGHRPEHLREYIGSGLVSPRKRKLICLPTTSGAGSEASPNAIMVDEVDHQKKAIISPYLIPDLVLIDPELTLTLPPHVTAATGFDALCHCIEAFANKHAHALVDAFALQGISLIAQNIVCATNEGSNLAAREAMALGSYLGGVCLGPVNTAAVHALSYPLGSAFGLPHGLANAVLLPHVLRYNLPAMPDRYA